MFSFFKKHKFLFDILALIIFAGGSVMYWFDYSANENKKIHLIAAIVMGVMAILKLTDVIEYIRERKLPVDKTIVENKIIKPL